MMAKQLGQRLGLRMVFVLVLLLGTTLVSALLALPWESEMDSLSAMELGLMSWGKPKA